MGTIVFISCWLIPTGYLPKLIIQILLGGILVFSISELLRLESYLYIKEIVKAKLISIYNARK